MTESPSGIATAISAIYASGAKGHDTSVLIALAHACDWRDPAGSTTIDIVTIANHHGIAESVVRTHLASLVAAGVVVEERRGFNQSKRRRIEWSVLASYVSEGTKRGGAVRRTPAVQNAEHRRSDAPPNIGATDRRTSADCPPNTGALTAEHRHLSSSLPPTDPPKGSSQDRAHDPAPPSAAAAPRKKGRQPRPLRVPPETWEALLGAVAELSPDDARNIDAGKSTRLARSLEELALHPDVGSEGALRRLRYVARFREAYWPALWWSDADRRDLAGLLRPFGKKMVPALDLEAERAANGSQASRLLDPTPARWRDPGWTPTRPALSPPARAAPRSWSRDLTEADLQAALTGRPTANPPTRNDHDVLEGT